MKAAVALLVSVSLLGCFPNNARRRMYAQWAEGGALVGGIAIAAVGNTGADCDAMKTGVDDCKDKAQLLSTIGVSLILVGLLGFVATISTAEDDNDSKIVVEKTGAGSGSAAPADNAAAGTGSAATPTDGAGSAAPTEGAGSGSAMAPDATGSGSAAPATP